MTLVVMMMMMMVVMLINMMIMITTITWDLPRTMIPLSVSHKTSQCHFCLAAWLTFCQFCTQFFQDQAKKKIMVHMTQIHILYSDKRAVLKKSLVLCCLPCDEFGFPGFENGTRASSMSPDPISVQFLRTNFVPPGNLPFCKTFNMSAISHRLNIVVTQRLKEDVPFQNWWIFIADFLTYWGCIWPWNVPRNTQYLLQGQRLFETFPKNHPFPWMMASLINLCDLSNICGYDGMPRCYGAFIQQLVSGVWNICPDVKSFGPFASLKINHYALRTKYWLKTKQNMGVC